MFYIKSDDIDELFREAAEKYDINTEKAEAWEDVHAAVHSDDAPLPPPATHEQGKKQRWFVFAWLLLIPLGWFAHNIWSALTVPGARQAMVQPAQNSSAGTTVQGLPKTQETDNKAGNGNNTPVAVAAVPGHKEPGKTEKPPVEGSSAQFAKHGIVFNMHVKPAAAAPDVNAGPGKNAGPGLQSSNQAKIDNSVNVNNGSSAVTGAQGRVNTETNAGVAAVNPPPAGDKSMAAVNSATPPGSGSAGAAPVNNIAGESNSSKGAGKVKDNGRKSGYFYAGFTAAPDISFIRLQRPSSIGAGAGVLVGYQLTKKLAVESGAILEKKYYYTNGEYFDISKVRYFVNNNIRPDKVTGNCNMVEVPLNLKYTFKTKGAASFYLVGGASSYLMGHESYTFNYKDWGAEQQSTWNYHNRADYWFSVLNVGAGYERMLGRKTNFRIEPYAKLPLSGLGTGNLKIASAGLYLTLTRKIP